MHNRVSISQYGRKAAIVSGICLLGIAHGWGQAAPPQPNPSGSDPFAAYHASLANTADKLLASPPRLPVETPGSNPAPPDVSAESAIVNVRGVSAAIDRVRQLQPVIEPILREENVPAELAAIVLVESGGRPNALSPRGARGIWQFMPDTARRYGLIVTPEWDERTDTPRSTRAAARYLRDLYEQFGDWQLAFAAYNAGGDVVEHAIRRNGTHDFSKLSRSVPLETRKYVPAVVAATKMFSNPDSAMTAVRPVRPLWKVYADAQPAN